MKTAEIIKAWKNEEYRATLGPMQLQELQENPAGDIELTEADCALVSGCGRPSKAFSGTLFFI